MGPRFKSPVDSAVNEYQPLGWGVLCVTLASWPGGVTTHKLLYAIETGISSCRIFHLRSWQQLFYLLLAPELEPQTEASKKLKFGVKRGRSNLAIAQQKVIMDIVNALYQSLALDRVWAVSYSVPQTVKCVQLKGKLALRYQELITARSHHWTCSVHSIGI